MPTRRYYSNAAPSLTLASGITNTQTTLSISGSFAGWPSSYPFFAALDMGTASFEIVSVTAVTGTTATIARGQNGTAALAHSAGATLDQVVIAQDLDEANAHTSANSGVHGVAGSVVGTTDTQTLTNKTLNSPTISGGSQSSPAITTPTISNPTITGGTLSAPGISNPAFSGTATGLVSTGTHDTNGTYDTPTINSPTVNTPTITNPTISGSNWDSGWISLGAVVNGSWATSSAPDLPQYRKVGGIVYLVGSVVRQGTNLNNDASWGLALFNDLPVGYRPSVPMQGVCTAATTGGARIEMKVDTDGSIVFRNTGAAALAPGIGVGLWIAYPVG